jgi:hypothetical protein
MPTILDLLDHLEDKVLLSEAGSDFPDSGVCTNAYRFDYLVIFHELASPVLIKVCESLV